MSLLTIDHLTAGYGKLEVIREVSLAVEAGQFIGLIGPNGSGKSTLVKSVFGLTDVLGGRISLRDSLLNDAPTETISAYGLAYVPQTQNVFTSLTVHENLSLAARGLKRDQVGHALEQVFELFPILRERRSQRGGQLSGGERQMLAIAMAWLPGPELMLLDEPSAGLAPLLVAEVFKQLRQLCDRGITLIVVEQNARSLLRWCDYGYVLREGRLVFHGPSAAILADEETAKNYLGVAPRNSAH